MPLAVTLRFGGLDCLSGHFGGRFLASSLAQGDDLVEQCQAFGVNRFPSPF